jgi:hypothetical protein
MSFNHQYNPEFTLFVRNIHVVFPDDKSHYNDVKDEVQKQLGNDSVSNVFHESGKNYGFIELRQIEYKEILLKQKNIYVTETECLIFSEYRRYSPNSSRIRSSYEDGEVIDKSTFTKTTRDIYSNNHDFDERNKHTLTRKRDRNYLSSRQNISNQFETMKRNTQSSSFFPNHEKHPRRHHHHHHQQQVAFIPFIVDPKNSMMYPQYPSMNFQIQDRMALLNHNHDCYEKPYSQRNSNKKAKY